MFVIDLRAGCSDLKKTGFFKPLRKVGKGFEIKIISIDRSEWAVQSLRSFTGPL